MNLPFFFLHFYRLSGLKNCEVKGQKLECALKKIKKDNISKIELYLPLPEENFKDEENFQILPMLSSTCLDKDSLIQLDRTTWNLKFESDLRMKILEGQEQSKNYARNIKNKLVQHIEVTNLGPSFTNKETKVTVFVPKFDFLESKVQLENSNCTLLKSLQVPTGRGDISPSNFGPPQLEPEIKNYYCESKETCQVYECTIAKHWEKDETKVINVELNIGILFPPFFVP